MERPEEGSVSAEMAFRGGVDRQPTSRRALGLMTLSEILDQTVAMTA